MASLRELRRKVKSVKSTQQITKAMKMVSAARLRRAQGRIVSARPFADQMAGMLSDVLWQVADVNNDGVLSKDELSHPLLNGNPEGPRGLLLITADRGLCGAFNTNLIKKTLEFLRQSPGRPVTLFCAGRKGRDYFRRLGLAMGGEYVGIFNQLSYAQAELIGNDVMKFFKGETVPAQSPGTAGGARVAEIPAAPAQGSGTAGGARVAEIPAADVTMIYTEFRSAINQQVVSVPLLPLTPPPRNTDERWTAPFIYEPRRETLLEGLFPRYLKAQIFRALLESSAAELGARMTAMENASKNASELIASLTLTANKIRQAAITKEISELVGGAEALQ